MDPVDSLIGALFIGFGVMLLFGAVKNRRVFGVDGILSRALSTGSIKNLPDTEAFPSAGMRGTRDTVPVVPGQGKDVSAVQHAVDNIGQVDRSLADQINTQISVAYEGSTRQDLMPLAQLLAIANGKGRAVDVAVIKTYILGLTGEAI